MKHNLVNIIMSTYRFRRKAPSDTDWISIQSSRTDGWSKSQVGKKGGEQLVLIAPDHFKTLDGSGSLGRKTKPHGRTMHELMHAIGRQFYYLEALLALII